ncbi:arsenate reductase family protein [Labilibaculum antarcticum]|uniref:Arsenate reductase n=1 Tax=Labilibaculum antarcticum TaxID=1717717 RepID=A0A1Y1CR54_9BACT|nr:ArsC/Spx/MgsR family protein [Labilibaculum antarcticum]BAX81721.1 hypothetical protein ALGA_3423 [Labilibaculum antarcticum]
MKKIYHLSGCSTCKRIIKDLNPGADFILQDIKTDKISEEQLNQMAELSGSYESLFSRRAIKFKELNLKDKDVSEEEYKNLILNEYTFLKRPVVIIGSQIFVGNSKEVVASAIKELHSI